MQRAEEELAEKRRTLENAAEWTGKRESESRRELEKIKKIHKEQHEEMEKQIEMVSFYNICDLGKIHMAVGIICGDRIDFSKRTSLTFFICVYMSLQKWLSSI